MEIYSTLFSSNLFTNEILYIEITQQSDAVVSLKIEDGEHLKKFFEDSCASINSLQRAHC